MGACLSLLAVLACSSTTPPGDAASTGDAGPTASCQDIRMCAFECADDGCVQACRAKGTAATQAAFDGLDACTVKVCARGDIPCACGEQCLADGMCLAAVDACLGTASDPICDTLCH